jgi:uncharacterized integral membrane protein (TIGR00698 family)
MVGKQDMRVTVPGLGVAAVAAVVAVGVASLAGPLSPLPVAILLGIVVGNAVPLPDALGPGLGFAGKVVLRIGIALLGLRLVLGDVAALGLPAVALVAGISIATLLGVTLFARRLGLRTELGLLTGAGFAICGASAVAATQGVVRADEEDVAASLANVMLFGTLSIVALPAVAALLGLPASVAGAWIGAAVHDVGQVVATAGVVGETALEAAVVVKLGRVLLLGPLVIALGVYARRTGRTPETKRPSIVPWFVVAFLAAALLRSLELVPAPVLDVASTVEQLAFATALFALGTGVRLGRLRALGPRPLAMGAAAWLLIATLALVGVRFVLA